jgi:RNA polymerase sigma-70 factor (ECF subfamily)
MVRLSSSRAELHQALETALREHGDRLYALAKRVTGDPDLAADAVQAAFASALESADAFRGDAALSTWLHRIVYNKSIDILRARGREVPLSDDAAAGSDLDLAHAPSWARADGNVAQAELTRALNTAFADLTPVQRAVFEMREEEGQTTEEVAAALSLNPGAVRLHLHRARLKLRARLSGILGEAKR